MDLDSGQGCLGGFETSRGRHHPPWSQPQVRPMLVKPAKAVVSATPAFSAFTPKNPKIVHGQFVYAVHAASVAPIPRASLGFHFSYLLVIECICMMSAAKFNTVVIVRVNQYLWVFVPTQPIDNHTQGQQYPYPSMRVWVLGRLGVG